MALLTDDRVVGSGIVRFPPWLLAATLLPAGCAYTAADFEAHYPPLACDRMERCQTWSSLRLERTACVRSREAELDDLATERLPFDPDSARHCLHALIEQPCDRGARPRELSACAFIGFSAIEEPVPPPPPPDLPPPPG